MGTRPGIKAPVIAGKYTLLRKLGAGGMAEVFLAKQRSTIAGQADADTPSASSGGFEKLVVLKRIIPHLIDGPGGSEFLSMFLDEARLASDLRHPNVVSIIDLGNSGSSPFIVMEFLHGQDVRKVQRKNAALQEMVPLGHACQIVIDAAAGLHHAHFKKDLSGKPLGIVHRDVSPQNIIVTYDGATKIVDFGIAKAASQSTHTQTGVLKGKYTYMSPEQAAGEVVDHRTDQFALGIVMWELLTMRRLFKRDTEMHTLDAIMSGQVPRPSRFREDLPRAIDDVVMRALARKREDRFEDCQAFAVALEDALLSSQIAHSPARLSQYMRRIFADQMAEEATLGLVNPDGSLTKNFTPFFAPPRSSESREARPTVDATTADRGQGRSKSEGGEAESVPRRSTSQHEAPAVLTDAPRSPKKTTAVVRVEKSVAPSRSPTSSLTAASRVQTHRSASPNLRAALPVMAGVGAAAVALVVVLLLTGEGTVVVRTEPRGATVLLNGNPVGQSTPALIKGIAVGEPVKIHVELGTRTAEEIVSLSFRGQTLDMRLDLAEPANSLPPGAPSAK